MEGKEVPNEENRKTLGEKENNQYSEKQQTGNQQ